MLLIAKSCCTVVGAEETRVSSMEAAGPCSVWLGNCGCRKLLVHNAIVVVWQVIISGLFAPLCYTSFVCSVLLTWEQEEASLQGNKEFWGKRILDCFQRPEFEADWFESNWICFLIRCSGSHKREYLFGWFWKYLCASLHTACHLGCFFFLLNQSKLVTFAWKIIWKSISLVNQLS